MKEKDLSTMISDCNQLLDIIENQIATLHQEKTDVLKLRELLEAGLEVR